VEPDFYFVGKLFSTLLQAKASRLMSHFLRFDVFLDDFFCIVFLNIFMLVISERI
jgi:hypothetical protein